MERMARNSVQARQAKQRASALQGMATRLGNVGLGARARQGDYAWQFKARL
jgi:hypothetical protein